MYVKIRNSEEEIRQKTKSVITGIRMIEFFQNNYEWLMSGVGSGLIFWLIGHKQGYNKAINQQLTVGNNSNVIQAGGNVANNDGRK